MNGLLQALAEGSFQRPEATLMDDGSHPASFQFHTHAAMHLTNHEVPSLIPINFPTHTASQW